MNNSASISKLVKDFSKNPQNCEIPFNVGLLYADDGDYAGAFEWFSKAYSLNPKYSAAYFFSALSCICIDRYDKAADLWELFMKTERSPFDFYAEFKFPFSFDFEKLRRKSFSLCKNRRKLLPFDVPPVYLSALTHLFLGDAASAMEFFESLEGKPGLPRSLPVILSEVYLRNGMRERAISVLSDFCRDAPGFFPALFRLASLLLEDGKFDMAAKRFMDAFRAKQTPQILISAAEAFSGAGRRDLAVECLEGALMLDESRPEPYRELGRVSFELGDFLSCFLFMRRAEEMDPSSPDPAFYSAMSMCRWGDCAGAVPLFYRALDLGITDPSINLRLSEALERIGEFEEAAYQLLVFGNLSENPDSSLVARLAGLLSRAGLEEDAVMIERSFVEENPDSSDELLLPLAMRLLGSGDQEGAMELAERAAAKGSPFAVLLKGRIRGFDGLGAEVAAAAKSVSGGRGDRFASLLSPEEREGLLLDMVSSL